MPRRLVAIICLSLVLPWNATTARGAAGAPAEETGPRSVRAGAFEVSAAPAEPVRALRVQDNTGQVLVFDARRGVEFFIQGESRETTLPALTGRLRVRTDAGEEAQLDPPEPEVTRHPNGSRFSARYAVNLPAMKQPYHQLRLQGEIAEALPAVTVTQRVRVPVSRGLQPTDLGPVRVSAEPATPAEGGAAVSVTCEWEPADVSAAAARWREVAGPLRAELCDTDGHPFALMRTVAVDTGNNGGEPGEPQHRKQRFVWRVGAAAEGELVLTYTSVPRRLTSFTLENVAVPDPGPPAFARMQAEMFTLQPPDADVEADDPPAAMEAPHPLLDRVHGGALRFRLRVDSQPAGPGAIQAALAARQGAASGPWYWFAGQTNAAGEATLANVRPGVYRLRVRYRARPRQDYTAPDTEVTVRTGTTVSLPAWDLRRVEGNRVMRWRR